MRTFELYSLLIYPARRKLTYTCCTSHKTFKNVNMIRRMDQFGDVKELNSEHKYSLTLHERRNTHK